MRLPGSTSNHSDGLSLLLAAMLFVVACGPAPTSQISQDLSLPNGVSLNGVSLNGVSLNGVSLNGVSLNGVSLNGVSLNGSELVGVGANGEPLSGPDFVGATFTGQMGDGSTIDIQIFTWWEEPISVHNYALYYAVLDKRGRVTWKWLCYGIPLAGRWDLGEGVPGGGSWIDDPQTFTFACHGAALAKCVQLGYRPWEGQGTSGDGSGWGTQGAVSSPGDEQGAMRSYHQTCTRVLRADYCGDGQPWTEDGRTINLFDRKGIQKDSESFKTEAEWSPAGASCIHKTRADEIWATGMSPWCFGSIVDEVGKCGQDFSNPDTLVINEYEQSKHPGGGKGGGKK